MQTTLQSFLMESNRIEGVHHINAVEVEAAITFLMQSTLANLTSYVFATAGYNQSLRDTEGLDVRVGNHIAPRGGPIIRQHLEELLAAAQGHSADPFLIHCEYETLHPYTDGNGRSGRLLWLRIMGDAPLGFLHHFYYQALEHADGRRNAKS